MNIVFCILHIALLLTYPVLLIVTIPLHIIASIVASSSKRSEKERQLQTQLIKSQDAARATEKQLEQKQELVEMAKGVQKKWEVAKQYTNEVKDGLEFVFSQVGEDERSRSEAELALKDVFFELGIASINKSVLDNIVSSVNEKKQVSGGERGEVVKGEQDLQLGAEDKLIEKLYDAVKKSNIKLVSEMLSQNVISNTSIVMHKESLKTIARKRGDRSMRRLIEGA